MAKSKKRKIFSDYSDLTIFTVVLAIVTLGVVVWLFTNLTSTISEHRALEAQNNQACVGISAASNSGLDVDVSTLYATAELKEDSGQGEIANQRCVVAGSTKTEIFNNKTIESYNFGAEVAYFKTSDDATSYASDVVNSLREWEIDDSKSTYTFLVSGNSIHYFDAYAVNGNAVLRISLPCSNETETSQANSDACQAKADRTIAIFDKKLNPLNL